jgi:hypothetical protein
MKCVHDFLEKNQNEPLTYEGDLEADYIEFLAKVQKAAKKNQWMLSLIFHEVSAKPFSEHI